MAALALGAAALTREPLWDDELASVALVGRPLNEFVQELPLEHNGMLFHFALWPVVALGGTSEFLLRSPSLLAFVAAVVLCALVGARLADRRVGLCAAALLAVSPLALPLVQQVRMYGFALLFALLAVWALLRALEHPSRGRWALYAVSVALAGYSHDFALLTVVAHPLLVWREGPKARRAFALALAAAAMLLVPLAIVVAKDWGSDPIYWLPEPRLRVLYDTAKAFAGSAAGVVVATAVLVAGAVVLLVRRDRPRPRGIGAVPFLAVWLVGPFAILFAASFAKPLLLPRYLLPSVPALCLLLAVALGLLGWRAGSALAAILIAVFALQAVRDEVEVVNTDWPALGRSLDARWNPGEPVLIVEPLLENFTSNANMVAYYTPRLGFDRGRLFWARDQVENLPSPLGRLDPALSDAEIAALARGRPAVWLAVQGPEGYDLARIADATGCSDVERSDYRGAALLRLASC